MCARAADQDPALGATFDAVNLAFMAIFNIEAVLKLMALRDLYFVESWNIFDILVVIATDVFFILGLFLSDGGVISKLGPVIRSLRIMRMVRLIRRAKGFVRLFANFAANSAFVLKHS